VSPPDYGPLTSDGFAGIAVGDLRGKTFVTADRSQGDLPRISTTAPGQAAEGIAARDANDGDRIEVISAGGHVLRVLSGAWLKPNDMIEVGPGGVAVAQRDGHPVGRVTGVGQPGWEVEIAR
jgi:hypothetical protein